MGDLVDFEVVGPGKGRGHEFPGLDTRGSSQQHGQELPGLGMSAQEGSAQQQATSTIAITRFCWMLQNGAAVSRALQGASVPSTK